MLMLKKVSFSSILNVQLCTMCMISEHFPPLCSKEILLCVMWPGKYKTYRYHFVENGLSNDLGVRHKYK